MSAFDIHYGAMDDTYYSDVLLEKRCEDEEEKEEGPGRRNFQFCASQS